MLETIKQLRKQLRKHTSALWLMTILVGGSSFSAAGNENAAVMTVSSIKELEAAVAKAKAGLTIILKDGTYTEPCTLKGNGTQEVPIVIRAATIGGVEMKGGIAIEGNYISLNGFSFTANGYIYVNNSSGCRISRCHMNNLAARQWLVVSPSSRQIEIDHCLFEKKENNRTGDGGCQLLMIVLLNKGESHHIHHNHFRDIPKGKDDNGFETIQLITKNNNMNPKGSTGNVVEYNLFERCDGEAEIISVKSSGNLLRGNTFRDCKGELVLRHGHLNVVNGNWFVGGNGGVRLQGSDQVVINNYFDSLAGTGLVMMDGTAKNFYMRVERALIANNTFVNCKEALFIGQNHPNYPEGTVPRACMISNNIFYQGKSVKTGLITFNQNQEPEEWTWQNNIYHGNLGISGRVGLKESSAFQITAEPKLLLPKAGTPSTGHTELKWPEGYDKTRAGKILEELRIDLAGATRPEQGTVGAIQYIGKPVAARPLTEKDVGPLSGLKK